MVEKQKQKGTGTINLLLRDDCFTHQESGRIGRPDLFHELQSIGFGPEVSHRYFEIRVHVRTIDGNLRITDQKLNGNRFGLSPGGLFVIKIDPQTLTIHVSGGIGFHLFLQLVFHRRRHLNTSSHLHHQLVKL